MEKWTRVFLSATLEFSTINNFASQLILCLKGVEQNSQRDIGLPFGPGSSVDMACAS